MGGMRGTFIAVEGGDGAGKDTQIELLKKEFGGPGFVYTREPGGTALGTYLRQALFHEAAGVVGIPAEFFMILADRAQHAEEVVRPALAGGAAVISNRSWLSAYAYQIYGRDAPELTSLLEQCLAYAYRDCPIDLAIVLDILPHVGRKRQKDAGKVPDTMEQMPLELHERVREGFLQTAARLPFATVIDANRGIEVVYADVRAAVAAVIDKKSAPQGSGATN